MNTPSSSAGQFRTNPSTQTPAGNQRAVASIQNGMQEVPLKFGPPPAPPAPPVPPVPIVAVVEPVRPSNNPVAVVTTEEATAMQLSEPQRTAIIRLTSGATRVEAATAAGVTRNTLYRWLTHDPNFAAAYHAWQKDLVTTAQGQLLAASQEAIAVVLTAIRRGDARLAWKLLVSQGLTKAIKPGSTDVRELQRKEALDSKRQEIAEKKEVNEIMMDDMSTIAQCPSPLG